MLKALIAPWIAFATVQAHASLDCTVKIFMEGKKKSEAKIDLKAVAKILENFGPREMATPLMFS